MREDLTSIRTAPPTDDDPRWRSMDIAPTDGRAIWVRNDECEPFLVCWAETRACMLAGIGGGNGYFGPGWEDCENHLVVTMNVTGWLPESLEEAANATQVMDAPYCEICGESPATVRLDECASCRECAIVEEGFSVV